MDELWDPLLLKSWSKRERTFVAIAAGMLVWVAWYQLTLPIFHPWGGLGIGIYFFLGIVVGMVPALVLAVDAYLVAFAGFALYWVIQALTNLPR